MLQQATRSLMTSQIPCGSTSLIGSQIPCGSASQTAPVRPPIVYNWADSDSDDDELVEVSVQKEKEIPQQSQCPWKPSYSSNSIKFDNIKEEQSSETSNIIQHSNGGGMNCNSSNSNTNNSNSSNSFNTWQHVSQQRRPSDLPKRVVYHKSVNPLVSSTPSKEKQCVCSSVFTGKKCNHCANNTCTFVGFPNHYTNDEKAAYTAALKAYALQNPPANPKNYSWICKHFDECRNMGGNCKKFHHIL